jgi:hypothetical protein
MKQGDGKESSTGVGKTRLHDGLQTRSASATDASTKPKGGSVNDEPTRKSVAPTPGSIGGRCA